MPSTISSHACLLHQYWHILIFSKLFLVHTDASASAIGGILSQHNEEGEQVIAYWSRQLSKAERNYSTVEREALAAVVAIKEFYPYLYGFPFKLIVDHNPLTALKELKDVGGRLARWAIFLQQFDFTVEYKPGKDHRNADALSRRRGESDDQVNAVDQEPKPSLSDIRSAQLQDSELKPLIQALNDNSPTRPGLKRCFIDDGVLCRKFHQVGGLVHTQTVVPSVLQEAVLAQLHNSSGHFGIRKTIEKVKERFYWPGYEEDVEKWVRECSACQRRNPPQQLPRAPLGTIKVSRPFEKVSWAIMGPLPISSRGNKYIFVVTDLFTKWVEAFPLKDTVSPTLARILVDEVISRYEMPESIHSDQGANLRSELICSLCALLGMNRTQTSAYHPQGNGQVERFNRTVEAILAKHVKENQRDWDSCLPKALWAYRTSFRSLRALPHSIYSLEGLPSYQWM